MYFIREESDILVNQRINYVANSDKEKINISSLVLMLSIISEWSSQDAAETLGDAEVSWLVFPNFIVHNLKIINL